MNDAMRSDASKLRLLLGSEPPIRYHSQSCGIVLSDLPRLLGGWQVRCRSCSAPTARAVAARVRDQVRLVSMLVKVSGSAALSSQLCCCWASDCARLTAGCCISLKCLLCTFACNGIGLTTHSSLHASHYSTKAQISRAFTKCGLICRVHVFKVKRLGLMMQ